jgi:hypothetical protein
MLLRNVANNSNCRPVKLAGLGFRMAAALQRRQILPN